jgi:hypothetical protein
MEAVEREWAEKEQELRRVWDIAAEAEAKGGAHIEGKRKEVPNWTIGNITFNVTIPGRRYFTSKICSLKLRQVRSR